MTWHLLYLWHIMHCIWQLTHDLWLWLVKINCSYLPQIRYQRKKSVGFFPQFGCCISLSLATTITMGPGAWPGTWRDAHYSILVSLHLLPCLSWSAPRGPPETRTSPLLASVTWSSSAHSSSCSSSTDSSKSSSRSRGRRRRTASRGESASGRVRGTGPDRSQESSVCPCTSGDPGASQSSAHKLRIHPPPSFRGGLSSLSPRKQISHKVLPNEPGTSDWQSKSWGMTLSS